MGKLYEAIDKRLEDFIGRQKLFFVATAPVEGGHVNLSPKGFDSFRVLGPTEVAYQDLVGSGAETIAHIRQNGRVTLMFCALEGPPLILRLHGQGEVIEPTDPAYAALAPKFPAQMGARSIIRVAVTRIADSCGFGVPVYEFQRERDQLQRWTESKGPAGLVKYRNEKNRASIDGIPALEPVE